MSNIPTNNKNRLTHARKIELLLIIYDFAAVNLAYFLALWLRFDLHFSEIPFRYLNAWKLFTIPYAFVSIGVFYWQRLYHSIWRFASYNELFHAIIANVITAFIHVIGITFIRRMPITYYTFGAILQLIFVMGIRFSYRFILLIRGNRKNNSNAKCRVAVVGAGSAGQLLARDIMTNSGYEDTVVCFIDDNPNKWGRAIDGIPVAEGGRENIMGTVEKFKVEKIYLAIPSAPLKDRKEILTICNETGCELKQIPGTAELLSGESNVDVNSLRKIKLEDLLGRDPIKINMKEVYDFINRKVILVTGGGGSIGSELCRQVAAHSPKQLIILDIYENNAYSIQLELKAKYPELNLVTLIGSVRDSRRLKQVFDEYRPDVVYHAAAHKHVPLMEDSPCESIKNNAIGTYKTAYQAMTHGCKRFVLISTDKAVNPTNIMGASKRLCEMIVQSFDRKIKNGTANSIPCLQTHKKSEVEQSSDEKPEIYSTEYVAVRFGNVLGSNGSVVPIFREQIKRGGPVTVTHPDIIRYFMTVQEAVSLVLQAGTYAHGGEIFVLDMGEPVKIDTMARNLIRLSGLKPDEDIKIEYTGLRPGEKLYEEKLMAEEGLIKTANNLIHIAQPLDFDEEYFINRLGTLMEVAYSNDENKIRQCVSELAKTYMYQRKQ